jgi:stage II sporulation protein D
MIKKLCLLVLAFMPFVAPADAAIADFFSKPACATPPAIKVLIVQNKPGVVLEVKGKYHVYDPNTKEYLGLRYLGKRKFIQALCDGIQWGEEFPGRHQLQIVPDNQCITTIVDGIEYRGSINIYDVQGAICVVNEVDVEDFVQSMLAPQARAKHSAETLAALAIAARTHAYYLMQNPKSPFWAVDASKIGYQGYAVTYGDSELDSAIYATRYLVMTTGLAQNGVAVPFPAYWGDQGKSLSEQSIAARISLNEGDSMAEKGDNAAKILTKAFPEIAIVLMHQTPSPKR